MWKGEGELHVSVVVAVYYPDWLLLIASTVCTISPMLLGEGRDVNLLMGLKTSIDTVLLSSSCVF